MTEEQKEWIDNATYAELLGRWRFAPVGDPMFQGEVGEYYASRMKALRDAAPGEAVQASKSVGWGV